MEEIPGKRAGSRIFLHEGFSYHKDTTSALQNIYRCSSRATTKCRGTVKIDRAEVHIVHRHHGHLPNPVISQENQMKSSVLQLCRETLRSFDEIFREMSVRYPQAALNITLLSMRRTMERERAKNRPVIPAELRLLDPVLSHHPSTRQMYCGMAMGTDHSIALIFARRSMLDRLNLATELFVDFTFKVAPRKPKTLQVLIIHIRRMGVAFPVLYGLCSRKTTAMYVAIWRFVLDLAPGMRLNLSRVTSDFEKAIINSVRRVFPGIETRGCWFHLCQALRRMWLKLGLRRAPRESLFMAMCIPLAPATRFVESIDIAEAVGNRIAEDFPAVTRFFRYMRTQWAPLAEVVAVGSTSLRTNNICETFHRYIVGRLGGAHPNIWLFVEKIDELMSSEEINWQRVEAGRRITRGSSPDQVEVDARIFDLQHQLLSGRYAQEVQDSVPFRSVKTNMERERARALPEVPASLLLLGMTLRDFVPMADLYRGTASGEDGNYALLFATAGTSASSLPQFVLCKKWYQLGLTAAPKEVLWMALSLPLAPVLRFAEGLDCIQTAGDRIADQYPEILNFVHYLRTVWLPLSDLVSVARPSLSTNSMCERYDRCLVSKLGRPHRSLWAFFDINPLDIFIRPCVACLAERPCIVYHDCRHIAMCDQLLQVRSSPSCRAPMVSTTQIFFA